MSRIPDLKNVADLYSDNLADHGTGARSVGWRDASGHLLRFRKLSEVIDPVGGPFSVNDLGCGYGSLYGFLKDRGLPLARYRGHDISEAMLREAQAAINDSDAEFSSAPQLDCIADYSIASGIFNVRFSETEAAWKDYILTTLHNMNEFSARGFSFNLLTSYVDWKEEHLFYGDPCFFFDYCKRNFSHAVSLLHDTRLWEWTMVVRK